MRLLNVKMHDGSRLFAALPARRLPGELREHLAGLAESGAAGMVGSAFDAWIEFTYRERAFSVNTVNDEYWFFANDESCPDAILEEVVRHAGRCLGGPPVGAVASFPLSPLGERAGVRGKR